MKKFLKIAFAVVAFAAVGLGSYKAYGSYSSSYSVRRSLLSENVEAMSRSESDVCYVVQCKTKPLPDGKWPGVMGLGKRHVCETKYASDSKDAEKFDLTCSDYTYASYSTKSYTQYCACWNCKHDHKSAGG